MDAERIATLVIAALAAVGGVGSWASSSTQRIRREVRALRTQQIETDTWIFSVRRICAQAGITLPPLPDSYTKDQEDP